MIKCKVKLRKLFQWTSYYSQNEYDERLPLKGLWMTDGVYNIGANNQTYDMVCIFAEGEYKYGQRVNINYMIIQEFMDQIEITNKGKLGNDNSK